MDTQLIRQLAVHVGVFFLVAITFSARSQICIPKTSGRNCTEVSLNEMDPKRSPYTGIDWKEPEWLKVTVEGEQYVDFMFVVDGSSTVGEENFATIMKWIGSFAQDFDLSTGRIQIGLVQYSHWYRARKSNKQRDMRTEIPLGLCTNITCLEERLNSVQLIGHTTFTGYAINKTVNDDFRSSRNFKSSFKIMVVITDSISRDRVLEAANYARKMDIHIYAIGITPGANINELREIATGKPLENNGIYILLNYPELQYITESLRSEIRSFYMRYVCPPLPPPIHGELNCTNHNVLGSKCTLNCNLKNFNVIGEEINTCNVYWPHFRWEHTPSICGMCKEKFDLLIVLDSSSSVSCPRFILAKKFISLMIDAMIIGPDDVQVATIRYYSNVDYEFSYSEYLDRRNLKEAFRKMEYCGTGTRTLEALKYATENLFNEESGRRADVPHITLLITDGPTKDNINDPSPQLRMMSKVFTIGLGNAQLDEMRDIASKPIPAELDRIFPDYHNLINATLVRTLLKHFCDAVTDVKSTFCNIAELDANATCERYEYSGELKPAGTSCQLPCAKGYENPNSSKAICTYEGTWHRDNWSCVEKACERPGNSNVVPVCDNGFKIDSSCQLKCRPGFELILPPDPTGCKRDQNGPLHCTRKCLRVENDDPMWDLDAIECKRTDVCTPTSCMNDGKCEKGVDEVTCKCTPGYTGILCENVIDECENINCNNGTCRNEIGSYVCECDEGYDGAHCENDIDDCANNRCGYYGTLRCVDQVNGYSCSCKRGFAGKYCDIFINECNSNPCKNGGTCNDGIGFFTCTCSSGYEGEFCQFEINECLKNLCNKTTTKDCIDGVSKYECVCFDGWSGTSCHKDIDECSQSPCVNDGKCINTLGSFECTCAAGYRGSLCAERIDLCRSHPCENGANCTSSVNSYACDCTPGYTGKTCSRNIDECHGVDCNNGRCEDGENEYSCICKDGFSGRHCAIEINECDPDPCVNGDCEDGVASYRCLCHPGHTGENCEIDIDYCENVVCLNGGKCKELVTDYECECKTGFEGPLCGRDVDECTFPENDCSGRGVCNNTNGGYSCECNAGYNGENCERNIDECKNHECKNKAECIDGINNYTCSCHEGYTGRYCETDIDDCSSNPCRNNATCRDELNRYECKCKPGFVGKHCQVVNKVCLSKPCKNKAKCNPLVDGGYRCDCERGYKGYNCEKDIDECKVRPPICRNGGTCKNRIGGWNCTCPQGYQGEMCETRLCKYPRQRTLEGDMTCSDGMMPGSKCVITCPKGFGMAQNSKRKFKASTRQEITCMKNFRWNYSNLYLQGNPPEWSCDPVTCREIEKAGADSELPFQMVDENVEMQQDAHHIHCTHDVEYNSTCSLKCHRNYTSIRGSDRRCTEVGTWSGQRWSCTPKKCNDSEIPEVENGGYKCTNGTRLGSVCSAVCNKGFKRYEKSDDRIFCKELNGVMTWSGLKPRVGYNSNSASKDHCWRCVSEKEISTHCNPCKMPFIKNGKYICNDGERQGSNCTVVCDPGFVGDSRNSELICDSVDGAMVWRTKRLSGNRCFESECDASVDLSALEMLGSDYIATVTPFYMDDSSQEELCGGQSVLSINVTRAVTIVMQLWYGRRLAGHHTTISTIGPAQTTSTGYTFAGVGDHFTVSGFQNTSAPNGKPSVSGTLPISAVPNSRVTITLSYDLWKLKSRGGSWEGKVSLSANSKTVIGSNSRWYTVYIGLNTDISGNRLENGRGLCKVCFIRN